jgi:predicted DNA-binding transcriptional regulator AlpA
MTSDQDKLRAADAAQLLGVGDSTWSAYVSRGQAPKPDGQYDRRTPWWYRSTITNFKASRPGRGYWRTSRDNQAADNDESGTGEAGQASDTTSPT